jgi:hypothetical protein
MDGLEKRAKYNFTDSSERSNYIIIWYERLNLEERETLTHRSSGNVFEAVFPFEGYTTWLHPFQVFQISKGPKHVLKLHCHIWQQNNMSYKNKLFPFAH